MSTIISIRTPDCVQCGCYYLFDASLEQKIAYENGAYVQDAFPDISPAIREMFISRICGVCWDEIFGKGE